MKQHKLSQWSSWGLWERWVLATTIAEVVSLAVICVLSVAVSPFGYVRGVLTLIGTTFGIVLGFAQWLVLRHYIRHSRRWIFATTIGSLFAWFTGLTIITVMAFVYAGASGDGTTAALIKGVVLLGGGLGAILGFCQWLVLKSEIRFSMWWILANALAWALGLLVAFVGVGMVPSGLTIQTALITAATGTAMGTVVGGITGITLVWLFKPRRKQVH